ncbi:MAG: hypothetical protein KBG15_16155 [Kofleriaceae bacterium]|nr:hypothetical protein [Kofleriaceae bacterium]
MPTNHSLRLAERIQPRRVTQSAKKLLAAALTVCLTAGFGLGFGSVAAAAPCITDCVERSAAASDLTGTESPLAAHRFTVGLPAEVTVVGLTMGIRPEVLYRFGCAGTRSRLRAAIGVLNGPDQFFVPVSVGYRAIFRQRSTVTAMVGVGGEWQNRIVSDLPTVRQYGLYLEGGVGIKATARFTIDFAVALDVMVFGGPGIGLGPRLGVQFAL